MYSFGYDALATFCDSIGQSLSWYSLLGIVLPGQCVCPSSVGDACLTVQDIRQSIEIDHRVQEPRTVHMIQVGGTEGLLRDFSH